MKLAVMALTAATFGATQLGAPLPLAAQHWHAEARLGRLDSRLEQQTIPGATSLGVGLGYEQRDGWLRISAGVPFGAEDPLWGAADAGRRIAFERGRFTLGIDLAAQGYLQRYTRALEQPGGLFEPPTLTEGTETGHGLAGQAMPLVAFRAGPATLRARGGWSYYRTSLGERDATRKATLAELQLAVQPAAALLLTLDGRQYWTQQREFRFAGATAVYALPDFTVWGSAGQWLEPSEQPLSWSAGAAVPFGNRYEVSLQARADALDPLYGSTPRRSWSAGLRVTLGDIERPAPPVPAAYDDGRATIALPVSAAAGQPRIAGDFNDWTPQPMTRAGEQWTFVARLEPGVYEYAFVNAQGEWFVPPSTPGRREDGMGGYVALLVVGGEK